MSLHHIRRLRAVVLAFKSVIAAYSVAADIVIAAVDKRPASFVSGAMIRLGALARRRPPAPSIVAGRSMALTQHEVGRRLRLARENRALTQAEVAELINLSPLTLDQIETGERALDHTELEALTSVYWVEIRHLLAADYNQTDPLSVFFRSNGDLTKRPEIIASLGRCIKLGSQLTNLEKFIGIARPPIDSAQAVVTEPRSKSAAFREGEGAAKRERLKLHLGEGAISDIAALLEAQGVRTAVVELPEDVSGLMIVDHEGSPLVVVNENEPPNRQMFSFAHEYAHVVLDRVPDRASVSRESLGSSLVEVRANAFAACFLMPEAGIRQFLTSIGKKNLQARHVLRGSREGAPERGSSARATIELHDVAFLASHFGVSRPAALFRLRDIGLLNGPELTDLLERDRLTGRDLVRVLGLSQPKPETVKQAFRQRLIELALEAYRVGEITRGKLRELLKAAGTSAPDRERILATLPADWDESLDFSPP